MFSLACYITSVFRLDVGKIQVSICVCVCVLQVFIIGLSLIIRSAIIALAIAVVPSEQAIVVFCIAQVRYVTWDFVQTTFGLEFTRLFQLCPNNIYSTWHRWGLGVFVTSNMGVVQ